MTKGKDTILGGWGEFSTFAIREISPFSVFVMAKNSPVDHPFTRSAKQTLTNMTIIPNLAAPLRSIHRGGSNASVWLRGNTMGRSSCYCTDRHRVGRFPYSIINSWHGHIEPCTNLHGPNNTPLYSLETVKIDIVLKFSSFYD